MLGVLIYNCDEETLIFIEFPYKFVLPSLLLNMALLRRHDIILSYLCGVALRKRADMEYIFYDLLFINRLFVPNIIHRTE